MDKQTPELTALSWYHPLLFVSLLSLPGLFTFAGSFKIIAIKSKSSSAFKSQLQTHCLWEVPTALLYPKSLPNWGSSAILLMFYARTTWPFVLRAWCSLCFHCPPVSEGAFITDVTYVEHPVFGPLPFLHRPPESLESFPYSNNSPLSSFVNSTGRWNSVCFL